MLKIHKPKMLNEREFTLLLRKFPMRKYRLFFVLICSLVKSSFAQVDLQNAVDWFVDDPVNKNASISIQIVDLDTDSVLAKANEFTSLMCASTAKLFSTSTALNVLGRDKRANTRFYTNGYIDSMGVLQGDLLIRGGGDVSLGSRFFNKEELEFSFMNDWLDSLMSLGIKSINGDVISDGSEFGYEGVPDGWDWSDMGNYYGAGASGITYFDNTLKFHFNTGKIDDKVEFVKTTPYTENLFFQHTIKAANIRKDYSYIYGSPFSLVRFGRGSLPANKEDFVVKGSMPDPEFQLAYDFKKFLLDTNFIVNGEAEGFRLLEIERFGYDSLQLLYSYPGKRVIDIVNKTNLYSVNLFAEGLLNLVGYHKYKYGSTNSGISGVYKYWAGKIDLGGLSLKDGSGLSRKNAVSASHFCQLLKQIYFSRISEDFIGSLPVAGVSGTLKYVCRGQKGAKKIFAKSGTLSNVKAYSGYVKTESGKNLAFAVIANNFNCSKSQIVKKMELIFNAMAIY